jgi:hypothetical protein
LHAAAAQQACVESEDAPCEDEDAGLCHRVHKRLPSIDAEIWLG